MPKYINLQLTNETSDSIPMRFEVNSNIPIIDDPSKYELSVIRFNLNNCDTPLFIFKDNYYKVSLTWKTNSVTTSVVYEDRGLDETEQSVYEIQHFVDMINTAFQTCFTALNALATLPTTNAPMVLYDTNTHLMALIAEKAYYGLVVTDPIYVDINYGLFKMIKGFPVISTGTNDKEYRFVIHDQHDNSYGNSSNFWKLTQQASSFELMSDFSKLVMTTSLPIVYEYTCETRSANKDVSLPILTDFVPSDLSINTFSNKIVYNAVTDYRRTELRGNSPVYNLSIVCYWSDGLGTLHPMYVPPSENSAIKIMLIRK